MQNASSMPVRASLSLKTIDLQLCSLAPERGLHNRKQGAPTLPLFPAAEKGALWSGTAVTQELPLGSQRRGAWDALRPARCASCSSPRPGSSLRKKIPEPPVLSTKPHPLQSWGAAGQGPLGSPDCTPVWASTVATLVRPLLSGPRSSLGVII